jgi:hypothetical protein
MLKSELDLHVIRPNRPYIKSLLSHQQPVTLTSAAASDPAHSEHGLACPPAAPNIERQPVSLAAASPCDYSSVHVM